MDTAMTHRIAAARAAENGISVDEALRVVLDRVPLGRMGTADDVADVIAFLLSDAASYVTGQALNACGALSLIERPSNPLQCTDGAPRTSKKGSGTTLLGIWHFSFTVSHLDGSVDFYTRLRRFESIHTQHQAAEYTRRLVGYPDADLLIAQLVIPGQPRGLSTHDLELLQYLARPEQRLRAYLPSKAATL